MGIPLFASGPAYPLDPKFKLHMWHQEASLPCSSAAVTHIRPSLGVEGFEGSG